ncbi:unnamed protein product [Arctogadus glacialis]
MFIRTKISHIGTDNPSFNFLQLQNQKTLIVSQFRVSPTRGRSTIYGLSRQKTRPSAGGSSFPPRCQDGGTEADVVVEDVGLGVVEVEVLEEVVVWVVEVVWVVVVVEVVVEVRVVEEMVVVVEVVWVVEVRVVEEMVVVVVEVVVEVRVVEEMVVVVVEVVSVVVVVVLGFGIDDLNG